MQIKFDPKYIIILIIVQYTPTVASIAHHDFATIHPYYDGDVRTTQLLTALILHFSGYDLKGLYSQALLRKLDRKKRKALELFQSFATVTAAQIGQLFGCRPRTSAQLCKDWVEEGFLVIVNPANKNRSYGLAPSYEVLVSGLGLIICNCVLKS